jgi:hypothetical protein
MRWSRAAKAPSLIRRRRVGWPSSSPVNGAALSLAVGEQAELFELVGGEEVCFVDGDDDGAAAFVFLGGEVLGGLGDQRGGVEPGGSAEAADDGGVEAAGSDGGVG